MVLSGVDFWYDNYGLWPWQAKPRPKTEYLLHDQDLTSAEIVHPTLTLSLSPYPSYFVARDWSGKPRDQPTVTLWKSAAYMYSAKF